MSTVIPEMFVDVNYKYLVNQNNLNTRCRFIMLDKKNTHFLYVSPAGKQVLFFCFVIPTDLSSVCKILILFYSFLFSLSDLLILN